VRRLTMLTLVVGTMILALSSGVALADHSIKGTDGNDVLRGTEDADYVEGRKGDDKLFGYGGDGANFSMEYGGLFAGYGDDVVYGGGDDLLYAIKAPTASTARRGTTRSGPRTRTRTSRTVARISSPAGRGRQYMGVRVPREQGPRALRRRQRLRYAPTDWT
jgi:RTX calcium-binding nonapeptide repeat (4 copies)